MVLRIVCDVFFLVSLVFALAGTKGIIKMPDTFSRMQASTCVSTLGLPRSCARRVQGRHPPGQAHGNR